MTAKVTRVQDGLVWARVRSREQQLDWRHFDLKPGDKVEVKRIVNNPFLVRVK